VGHEIYRMAVDKEKPAISYQVRAFGTLEISSDFNLVPEAGLEPAQAFTRGILSPIVRFDHDTY